MGKRNENSRRRAIMFHYIQIYIRNGCSGTSYKSMIPYGGESKVFGLSSMYYEVIPKNV